MKHLLPFLLFVMAVSALAAGGEKRWWRTGRLAKFNSESWTSSANTGVTCSTGGSVTNCSGGNTINLRHVSYYVTIIDGRNTFYAFRTLSWRWQRSPNLTENTKVKFAIDGENLILTDDDGREFKMSIGKKRQNTPTEELEECRDSVIDLHQEFATSDALENSLKQLSGPDLFNTFTSNLRCSNLCMQFQDWGLLTQFEAIRLSMLTARAGSGGSGPITQPGAVGELCEQTISSVEATPAIGLTVDQLAEKARALYQCAMADFQKGGDKWFLRTGQARMKILEEIVARQANAGIGEHYSGGDPAKP